MTKKASFWDVKHSTWVHRHDASGQFTASILRIAKGRELLTILKVDETQCCETSGEHTPVYGATLYKPGCVKPEAILAFYSYEGCFFFQPPMGYKKKDKLT